MRVTYGGRLLDWCNHPCDRAASPPPSRTTAQPGGTYPACTCQCVQEGGGGDRLHEERLPEQSNKLMSQRSMGVAVVIHREQLELSFQWLASVQINLSDPHPQFKFVGGLWGAIDPKLDHASIARSVKCRNRRCEQQP